jgi:hypothetical protein
VNLTTSALAPSRLALKACATGLALGLGLLTALPATAEFRPNESLVSPHRGLIDFEISDSRAQIVWTDNQSNMWLANINRKTGAFEPRSGRGELIATGTVSGWNMFMWNGPEWLTMRSGDQIFYSYYLPDKLRIARNTRMAVAVQDRTGAWVSHDISPELPRMSHIASKDFRDPNPRIKYLDPDLNQYWRNVLDPASETLITFVPPSNKSWRFASDQRAIMYTANVDGIDQVFRHWLDTGVDEQITTDAGQKDLGRTVPWLWRAPEFDNDFVLSTVVDESEFRVYRQLPGPDGTPQWTVIYSATLPGERVAGSPEFFTYNGKSYVFMAVYVNQTNYRYPSEVWVSNIDASDPLFRRITDDTLERARNDPEVFISDRGPLIYYNRYDPSIDPDHPLCADCSEGVYKANPGLGGR